MEPYLLRWSTSFYQALQAFLVPKFHQKKESLQKYIFRKRGDLNSFSSFFSSSSRFARPIPRRLPPWLKTQLPPSMPLDSEEVLKILSIVQMFEGVPEKKNPPLWYSISMLETLLWNASLLSQFMLHGVLWRGFSTITSNKTLHSVWNSLKKSNFTRFKRNAIFWVNFQPHAFV